MRLKGVKLSFANNYIRHSHYLNAVMTETDQYDIDFAVFYDIVSKEHTIKTVRKSKKTLVPFNDKKYFDATGRVFSFGHKDIPNT